MIRAVDTVKFLLVVFFLLDGQWVQGEASKGWGAFPYDTEQACMTGKARAEAIQVDLKRVNPRAFEKRFECMAEQIKSNN